MQITEKKKNVLKFILQLVIYLLVIYYIYERLSGNWDVFDKIEDFSFPLLIASIVVFAFHSIWNAIVWHYMISSPKYNLSLMGQIDIYLRSYLLRYIPGKVVGILSRALFNRVHGVPILKSLFAWCYENLLYLIIASVLGSFIIIRVGENSPIFGAVPLVPFFIFVIIIGLLTALNVDWFEKMFNKYLVPRLPKRVKRETDLLNISIKKRLDLFIGFTVSWLIYSVSFLLLVASIDISLLHTNVLELMSINALAWFIGFISLVTPSGGGIREWVMIFALEGVMHVIPQIAIIIALLARIVFILGELLGFGGFFIFKYMYNYVKPQTR